MPIQTKDVEYSILFLSIVIGLFYFVFRYLILDSFIWILFMPILSIFYLLNSKKYKLISNKMDLLILIYFIYGIIFLLMGLLLGPNKLNISRVFIHLYLPSVIYFIARKYSKFSIEKSFNIIRLIFIIHYSPLT